MSDFESSFAINCRYEASLEKVSLRMRRVVLQDSKMSIRELSIPK